MVARRQHHRKERPGRIWNRIRAAVGLRNVRINGLPGIQAEAGEDTRQIGNIGLRVAFQLDAVGIGLDRAIQIELVQANAEQLHHLACVVLVRLTTGGGIFLEIAPRVEVAAHGRAQRHGLQQLAKITQGARAQRVPVLRHGVAAPLEVDAHQGHDKELRQSQRQPLAHRIRRRQQLVPDHEVCRVGVVVKMVIVKGAVAMRVQPVNALLSWRGIELCVQPSRETLGTHAGQLRV